VIKRPELHDVLLFTGSTKWTWNEFESSSVKSYNFSCQRPFSHLHKKEWKFLE